NRRLGGRPEPPNQGDPDMSYDVVVVGGGNAAMCAALSAREHGARVLVLEKAPEAWRGGNGFFTAGGFRFAFQSFEDVCNLVVEAVGDGPGRIDMEYESAKKAGIDVRLEAKAQRLITDARGRVTGVEIRKPDGATETVESKAVVLASGGFEANIEMRTRYL